MKERKSCLRAGEIYRAVTQNRTGENRENGEFCRKDQTWVRHHISVCSVISSVPPVWV